MFIRASDLMQEELLSAIVRNPLVLPPDTTIMAAIAQMSEMRTLCQISKEANDPIEMETDAQSSCVIIVEKNNQPIGILTERDIVRLISQKAALENLLISDVMTRGLITLRESELSSLFDTIDLLRKHHIRHLLIVDDQGCLVGLLTHENLRRISRPVELLRLRRVEEVMTTDVVCAEPHLVMQEIAHRMSQYRVSSVVIVEEQSDDQGTRQIPLGIVTERDVVQCQALGLDIDTTPVQDVMSQPIFSVQLGESLLIVPEMMEQYRIQRLVVTDAQGGLQGIVTQTSLLQALNPLELYNLAKVLEEKVAELEAEKIQILQNRTVSLEQQVEARTATLRAKAEQERLIGTISRQIRASLDLSEILNTTVVEVRKILGCDRVAIWQLQPDFHLLNLAESHSEAIASRVGERVYDECFGPDWSEAYRQGRVQVISDIRTSGIADCHRELLENLQTRAKVLTPIIQGQTLWGLLEALEGHAPRQWQPEEVQLLEQLATQLAIAIQQANTHQKLQEQLEERQRLIVQLQESEKQYAILTSLAPVGIFRTDVSGCCTYMNDRCYELSGLSKEEALGYGWGKSIYPGDQDMVAAEWNRATQQQSTFSLEYRLQRPDGTVIWVYGQAVPEWDSDGNFLGYIETITDISARKRAEQALLQLNQSLEAKVKERTQELWQVNQLQRAILDGTDYAIISTDLNGIIQTFNAGAEKMLGYSMAEVIGQATPVRFFDVQEIYEKIAKSSRDLERDPLSDEELCKELKSLLLQGDLSEEWTHIRKDGSRFPVELSVNVLRDDHDRPIGCLSIGKDISDRKKAELQLQQTSDRLALALKSGAIGYWEWDMVNNTSVWDDQVYRLHGVPLGTPLSFEHWVKCIHPDDLPATQTLIDQVFAGQREFNTEYRVVHPDQSVHFIQSYGFVIQDIDGQPLKMTGVNFDISANKRAEKALQQQLAAIEAAIDGIAILQDDQYIYINPSHVTLFGYNHPDELLGKSWTTLYSAEELARFHREVFPALLSHRAWQGEAIATRRDGSTFAEELSLSITDDGLLICVCRDISDRKKAELQLQHTSDRLALALRSGAIGYWEWNIQQNILVWDDQMYDLYGRSKTTDVPLPYEIWANAVHPDEREFTENLLQQAALGQAEYDCEFRVVHPDHSIHYIKAYGKVTRDEQGNPQSMIGINFDITAQKQAEQTIHHQIEKETLLRQVTQHIRATLDLQQIFDTACEEIRQFIQTDRVGIFKFHPESGFDDGEFVAESVKEGFDSVLAIHVHDHCFGQDYAHRYGQGHFQAVSDVLNSDLQDCHKAVLARFQIRANLVIPLLRGDDLWGLLCIHTCNAPRVWEPDEIDLLQQIASQLAIAIQQGDLYNQIQAELIIRQQTEEKIVLELRRKQLLGEIIQSIRDSFDMAAILRNVTEKTQEILKGDRVIVFQLFPDGRSQIVEESVAAPFPALKNQHWEDEVWSQEVLDYYWQGIPRIVPDVMHDRWTDCLVEYSREGQIQSKMVAPILQEVNNNDEHRWVSHEKRDRLWGVLVIHACRQKREWQDQEAEILQQIANQLAIAIQQADLIEQLQQEQQKLIQSNEALAYSNADLARATRLKDEFLANMSHELRTPLNAILGITEGLQEGIFGTLNDKQSKSLKTIEKSGLHLLSLINDILDVAKIQSGQIELEYQSVSVTHLCSSSLTFLKQQALQKRIQLETKLAPDLSDIFVDERRIRQVLINLLTNAVKFTPEGGRVSLTAARLPQPDDAGQHYLRISVTDTGIGIAPENMSKLFQPFVQIDSALNRQYTGTGLGLVLVKQIVELHGGRVNLTSALGVGSCFSVDLPCQPETSAIGRSLPPTTELDDTSATLTEVPVACPLILLAEDNDANIITISSYLTAKGYRVISAKNGKEAIAMIHAESPNLILMDIQMPEMDGLETIRQLRQDPKLIETPIIALTALAMAGDRERCLEAGADGYISKPIRLKELATAIQELL